jgi:predicted Zn-dependent protease
VFATHPSNDQRLQEVVKESAELTALNPKRGRLEYLAKLDGLVFGDSVKQGVRYGHKFYHKDLGFALTFPENWRVENRPDRIVATARDNNAQMIVKLEDLNRRITPREFMEQRLKIKEPKQGSKLDGTALEAYTGITRLNWSFGDTFSRSLDTRVTVVYFRDKAYIIYGAAKSADGFAQTDPLFLAATRGFRALSPEEHKLAEGLRIEVTTAVASDTFAKLSKDSPIPNYPESILRLLNATYPSGEPQPGSKLKLIR